jgi:putative Mg2+ transporter-C (MgtC) family protein
MDPLTSQFWIAIGVAVLCGGIVGIERQMRGKPAGIRTNILICLGTTIFVKLSTLYSGQNTDPTRVLGQVVIGIGFLGAGVIIARGGHVKGVTSAAVIWTLAGIGAMIGFGLFAPAIALAVVTVVILTSLEFLETNIHWLRRGEHAPDGDSGSREE